MPLAPTLRGGLKSEWGPIGAGEESDVRDPEQGEPMSESWRPAPGSKSGRRGMTGTEDLFTPVHKGIRSMIYNLGGRLQTNDFSDLDVSKRLLADLEHEFSAALGSGCILCLVHAHASDEETGAFPKVAKFDNALITGLIEDHHDFTRRLAAITKMSREILADPNSEARVRSGVVLNQQVNDFFAAYIDHMNREEERLVPLMRQHLTDDEQRAMRSAVMGAMPPERMAATLAWMLPSLNVMELTGMLMGAKAGTPPEAFQRLVGLAQRTVGADRWKIVAPRLGL